MCNILELKSSFDTSELEENIVLKYLDYYNNLFGDNKNKFDSIFKITKFNLKSKKNPLKAKQLINILLKDWNNHDFERKVTLQSRKRGRIYKYYIKLNDNYIYKLFTLSVK